MTSLVSQQEELKRKHAQELAALQYERQQRELQLLVIDECNIQQLCLNKYAESRQLGQQRDQCAEAGLLHLVHCESTLKLALSAIDSYLASAPKR